MTRRPSLAEARKLVSNFPYWLADNNEYVIVLCVYIAVTIVFTWPLILNFTAYVNGNVQDIFHELWYMQLGASSTYGPFFQLYTSSIWYPTGVYLYYQVTSPFNTLIFMALSPIMGEIPAYNFLIMFTLFSSAFFTYILVKYLTHNTYAAFFAGLAYGFAPFHLSQELSHLNISSAEFLPLFAYFMIKLVRERRWRNSFYVAAMLVLNAMCDIHFLLLAISMAIIFLVYMALTSKRTILNKPFISRLSLAGIVAAPLGMLVYFQTLYGLAFVPKSAGLSQPLEAFITARSADLLSFVLPSPENPFFRSLTYYEYLQITPFRPVPISAGREFISFTVAAFAIAGLIANRKNKSVWMWLILTLLSFAVSLGPFVRIGGHVTPIAGPWNWLYFIVPFVNSFRAPERFDYLVALGLAVLAGYGVKSLMTAISEAKFRPNRSLTIKYAVIIIISLLVICEFIQVPNIETNVQIPPVYNIIAADHSNFAVLEVPVYRGYSVYLYYQSVYKHPLVNGGVPRTPQYPLVFEEATPFINQLGQYAPGHEPNPDIINQSISWSAVAPYILAQYNIKYVIIHKNLFSTPSTYLAYASMVSSVMGAPFYQDANIIAFRFNPAPGTGLLQFVSNPSNNAPIFSMLTGEWYSYGFFGRGTTRAMQTFAGLNITSATSQKIQLSFKVLGMFRNYPLQLSINGQVIGTYLATNSTFTQYATPFITLNQGINQVEFYSVNGCATPPTRSSISVLIQSAQRTISCVSAQFAWISPTYINTNIQT